MKHSNKDLMLVFLSVLSLVVLVAPVIFWDEMSVFAIFGCAGLAIFLYCTNFQCIAHYFLHLPFFKSQIANDAFSIFNTLSLGVPQSLYKAHHMNHHQFNNDVPAVVGEITQDRSSTYRYSSVLGQHEPLWRYALIGPFRSDYGFLFAKCEKMSLKKLAIVESVILLLFFAALALLNWKAFLLYYLPVWYLGEVGALAENYFEHYGSTPGNRLTDSVSSYVKWYNFVWFNNGYHQEHHFKPQVHWTGMPELKAKMLPENERKVLHTAHWFAWLGY